MESNLSAPAIVIFAQGDCTSLWNDVLLGIEEEGIPFVIRECHSTDIIHSAWLAACQSPLLVGIGCNRETLVVHYKNLPTSAPLFTLMYQQDSHARRSIGNNAARLVKGIPFRECHS
ncbi:glycerol dehydratase reactivase beta/small subunit family protein [Citrobacter sp. FP75]|uniref:glycerol dehydratase reactivase beta/small subunit family protein n=1 Tax=Citrobacter sp. FP75 TaxID=1852949 RepID=UPI001BC960B4|nr:glycerol dehydratase reactivase beta/small subunit family protein [Citrobacter sp. FP75]